MFSALYPGPGQPLTTCADCRIINAREFLNCWKHSDRQLTGHGPTVSKPFTDVMDVSVANSSKRRCVQTELQGRTAVVDKISLVSERFAVARWSITSNSAAPSPTC